jgi:hypothetical protein
MQPIVIVLARGMFKKFNPLHTKLIDQNRLLIISSIRKTITRPTTSTAEKRNNLIAKLSDKLFIPYHNQRGFLHKIVQEYNHKLQTL